MHAAQSIAILCTLATHGAVALKNARDFERVIHATTEILTNDLMNDEARILGDEAREKLEAAPFELRGRPTATGCELWAVTPEGTVAMSAVAELA